MKKVKNERKEKDHDKVESALVQSWTTHSFKIWHVLLANRTFLVFHIYVYFVLGLWNFLIHFLEKLRCHFINIHLNSLHFFWKLIW